VAVGVEQGRGVGRIARAPGVCGAVLAAGAVGTACAVSTMAPVAWAVGCVVVAVAPEVAKAKASVGAAGVAGFLASCPAWVAGTLTSVAALAAG
jgi:hypothetical protein